MSNQGKYCSDLSVHSQEALIGTVTPTQTYLLLEYHGAWGAKAIPESALPDDVKNWLSDQVNNLPNAKNLFIRRGSPQLDEEGVRFFAVNASEYNPKIYAFQLPRYQDLLSLDVSAALAGDPSYEKYRITAPLLLVCTHGRRDVCCASKGLPVFLALQDLMPDASPPQVWQVSHVGGHRFAANVICLPHGLLYGRVNPDIATAIIDSYNQGRIHLPNLRGRSCYSKYVQAAEYYLREQCADLNLDSFLLSNASEIDTGKWKINFNRAHMQSVHQLIVQMEETGVDVFQGCTFDKTSPQNNYKLVDYEMSTGPS